MLWREGQLADAYLHVTGGLATLAAAWGETRAALRDAGYRVGGYSGVEGGEAGPLTRVSRRRR
ncbi:MAG TPA: hypothetical protein VHB21_06970 [Minicystis sp.]|nr:hypothetical protein [Minicystis sp.]